MCSIGTWLLGMPSFASIFSVILISLIWGAEKLQKNEEESEQLTKAFEKNIRVLEFTLNDLKDENEKRKQIICEKDKLAEKVQHIHPHGPIHLQCTLHLI